MASDQEVLCHGQLKSIAKNPHSFKKCIVSVLPANLGWKLLCTGYGCESLNSPRGRGGGGWSPHIYTERPHPKVGPLPFYTPFLTKKVPIPFYCCKCTVFQIWINHKNRKFVFSTFSQPWNVSVGPFGPFNCPKWQIFLPFHILQLVKSLPFHIPEAWKRYPFRAEPPCIGHSRE